MLTITENINILSPEKEKVQPKRSTKVKPHLVDMSSDLL